MHNFFLITIRSFASLLLILTAFSGIFAQNAPQRSAVAEWLESYRAFGDFAPVEIFSPKNERSDALQSTVHNATLLRLDEAAFDALLHNPPQTLRLRLPAGDQPEMTLELVKTDILAPGFSVGTLGEHAADQVPYHASAHYRGIIQGNERSLAAISLSTDGVTGMVVADEDQWQIGKMEDGSEDHIFYRNADLQASSPFHCSSDEQAPDGAAQAAVEERGVGCKTVTVYFECDYKLFTDKGSTTAGAVNYVTALFNQVATLYANENVGIAIASIYVWTSPDPYAGMGSTASVLNAFRTTRGTNHNGNLAHFLSTRNLGGGIAYLDVICFKNYAHGVSAIGTSFQNVPAYSWTVEVVTHELGHNLGSWHTQSCNWPNGALDNCVSPEGSCAPGPAPQNGGTIMSYCHLSGYGINFNNGFGPVPGTRIRNQVLAASCLQQSGTAPTALGSSDITASTARLSWGAVSGATNYIVQYKAASASNWITLNAVTTPSLNLSGLSANTAYNWQVKTDCSSYSAMANFSTNNSTGGGGGGTSVCNAPSSLSNGTASSSSVVLQWAAPAGASSYTVQFKRSSSSIWSTAGNTSSTSYTLTGLLSSTTYNWRVKANCSGYSASGTFSTASSGSGNGGGSGCNAPATLNNNFVGATNASISWSSVPGATSYSLQIRIGSGAFFNLGTVSVTSVSVSGLSPSTNYQWRVKASCSGYSAPKNLLTAANISSEPNGGGVVEMPETTLLLEAPRLLLSPNPAVEWVSCRYSGPIGPVSTLLLTDVAGRVLRSQPMTEQQSTLDIADLPPGVFFLQLMDEGRCVATERLVRR
jgi:hypothetical protein